MDVLRGYRVRHRGTNIPLDADAAELVDVMARAAHERAIESGGNSYRSPTWVLLDDAADRVVQDWDGLKEETRRFSSDCMRHAFIALVVRCGARLEEIPEMGDA